MSSRRAPQGSAGPGADDPSESARSPADSLTSLPPEMTDGHSVGYPTGYGRRPGGRPDQDQICRTGRVARPPAAQEPTHPKTGEGRRKSTVTRTKPAEQRRAELLAAAQALFLAKGIAATSLDDITQRAGVSAGALDLSDPEATAVLCYASMHAFDLRGHGGPDDARLIRAAQQLVRRAAGLP